MKKYLSLFICAAILCLCLFSSCKTNSTAPDNNNNAGETAADFTNGSEENTGTTESLRIMPNLPDSDFGGKIYKVLGGDGVKYPQFTNFEIDAESISGDIVNDAVYNRNSKIEEKYNVVIEQDLQENPHDLLKKLINSGDDVYNLAFITQQNIGTMLTAGLFYDLNSLKYLDFEKPWWNQTVNKELSVNNKLYCTTSDFNMMDKNRTYILMFNKDMTQKYELGNLYDLVYTNKWTVDKMTELCKAVAIDLNGDGVMTEADQWGLGMDSYGAFYTLLGGCDNYIVSKDVGDYPVLSINNEHTVSSIDKLLPLTNDKTMSFYCNEFQDKVSYDHWYAAQNIFSEGRMLFTLLFTHSLQDIVRLNTNVDFGVLPLPKYDENQKDYISIPDSYWSALFAVPVTVQDVDFSSFMLELLSANSKYEVMPVYLEKSVKTKYTFDEESAKMLDTIFNGIRYDLGIVYDWSSISDIFKSTIPTSGKNDFVSKYEAIENKILASMQKTIDLFNELH